MRHAAGAAAAHGLRGIDLAAIGAVNSEGKAFVGFGARTGGLSHATDITSWVLTTPEPAIDFRVTAWQIDPASGQGSLTWNSAPGKTYRITGSTDLNGFPLILASGIASMSATHQTYYHRLRFNLGSYTTAAAASPLGHAANTNGFALTVPENPAATQTMWQSIDLDFWQPVSGASRSASNGILTFSAPPPLPEKCFYSVLNE